MSAEKFDVIVMGGGPGGSSTATLLARKGYKVLLLERERFPRFHIGESLLPAGWELWDALGVTKDLEDAGFIVKQGVNFRLFDAPKDLIFLTAEFPQYFQRGYAFHVERAKFDLILLNNARKYGVDAREEWSVKDVLFEGDRAIGVLAGPNGQEPKPIYAPMVVDATGRSCLLARKLGRCRPDPKLNRIAHFSHFQGAYVRLDENDQTMTDIHTTEDGWIWYIPLSKELVSIGAVVDARSMPHLKDPQARFELAISKSPQVREWMANSKQTIEMHTISSISYQNDDFVGNGFAMVGDASMFVDPIFSAGVTIALRGGLFVSEAIHDCFQAGDFSAERLRVYEKRIRRPMNRIFQMIYNWYDILQKKDTQSVFWLARKAPLLRERLIIVLSGGYDKVDMEEFMSMTEMEKEQEAMAGGSSPMGMAN